MRLFASVCSLEEAIKAKGVQGIELRLDLFSSLEREKIRRWIKKAAFPVLVTNSKEKDPETLFQWGASYVDLPDWTSKAQVAYFKKRYPKVKILISHHDFTGVPKNLEGLFHAMQKEGADFYKIAVYPSSSIKAMELLLWAKKHPNLTVIAMGEKGRFARILGRVMGHPFQYGYVKTPTAEGQISILEWQQGYHYLQLSATTSLYGLLGAPVEQSIGHLYHNKAFFLEKRDALYVKIPLEKEEFSQGLAFLKKMGFQGLSITTPLKKCFTQEPINTLVLQEGKWVPFNTDKEAAIELLEERMELSKKRGVLLGAGAVAEAIAKALYLKGVHLIILNRTKEKAALLAKKVQGEWGSLDQIPAAYDFLIQCSSALLEPSFLLPGACVMEIRYTPLDTPLLQKARKENIPWIDGKSFFERQALRQRHHWFSARGNAP